MTSLLRQIVAGPRLRHPEAGLDLCYVTDHIIATSGPSSTYPQRAYRNPTDQLVKFLDYKHGQNWAIWEFRAEGTGYPDSEVYNRIWHFPWPDHHPPPFAVIPSIMASMRNWLKGGKDRVVVVHCKAGKGRSGTVSCSYLISEEGWTPEDALQRFTERRMRSGFGAGVSIPSQLRWVGYVDRWTQNGKIYVERQVEILEVHVWGLRDGVKVAIEGYVDNGKKIKNFHVFGREERKIMDDGAGTPISADTGLTEPKGLLRAPNSDRNDQTQPGAERGGKSVLFRPSKRIVLPTNDVNIDFERRNKAAYGWTMVTSVAHVWFNSYFEGHGPEKKGNADTSGVFEIEWEKLDGIKGSATKGIKALEKVAVVWKALEGDETKKTVIQEPKEGEPVPQMQAADWRGEDADERPVDRGLGLRTETPTSANVSKANSVHHSINDGADESPNGPSIPLSQSPERLPDSNSDAPSFTVQHTNSEPAPPSEIVQGHTVSSTDELPGGKPEDELQDAKEHGLGHLKKNKKSKTSV